MYWSLKQNTEAAKGTATSRNYDEMMNEEEKYKTFEHCNRWTDEWRWKQKNLCEHVAIQKKVHVYVPTTYKQTKTKVKKWKVCRPIFFVPLVATCLTKKLGTK